VALRPRVRGVTVRQQFGAGHAIATVAALTGAAVLSAGLLVTLTDPETFPHPGTGIWWAITTITTVGYGDVVPASGAGRVIAAALMFGGFAALAFVTAIIASSIVVSEVEDEEQEIEAHERRIERQLAEVNARLVRLERLLAGDSAGEFPEHGGGERCDRGGHGSGQATAKARFGDLDGVEDEPAGPTGW
jgi:voltage-gated potassium channel